MTEGPIKNMEASVKQRLLNLSREKNEDFNFLLGRYALERFLFRLCRSEHGRDFVLKGAMLFHLRSAGVPHRPTRDLDLLSKGNPGIDRLAQLFRDVCGIESPEDGIVFQALTVRAERIKDDDEYLGVRLRIDASMGSARIPFQIDVGFGDAVFPNPQMEQLSTLLDLPAPRLRVYPWEAVIAEKYHAIVELGLDNSRMKDYFDL